MFAMKRKTKKTWNEKLEQNRKQRKDKDENEEKDEDNDDEDDDKVIGKLKDIEG